MNPTNMEDNDKISLELIHYTSEEIEKLKPTDVPLAAQKIQHEKTLESDLMKKAANKLHPIPTIALKRIFRNAGHRNVADDALFLENTVDVTKTFHERSTMSWMIKQLLVNLIRFIYTNFPKVDKKFITPQYKNNEEIHISPFFKRLGLNVVLNVEEVERIKSIPNVPIYDSNILINAIKQNKHINKENKEEWDENSTYVHYLDREWFTSQQLIDLCNQLRTVECPQDIKPIVCCKLSEKYPAGCFSNQCDKITQLIKDKSVREDALLTYLLHITPTPPDTITALYENHLERLTLKKRLKKIIKKVKLCEGESVSDWMDDTISVDRLKEKLKSMNATEEPLDESNLLTKIVKLNTHRETIKEYTKDVSYSNVYIGDLVMVHLSETINKHNNVRLETDFYMHFNTTDYYYIPKDTLKKAIEEIRSTLVLRDPKFRECGGLRPDMRRIIHYMIEQWISRVAQKTKKFLDIYKSTNNKAVSSTLSYKTMESYKILSD